MTTKKDPDSVKHATRRSLRGYVRFLHRYIGFFAIGCTLVFCLSGIALVYRDTAFLKRDALVERTVASNLDPQELGMALHYPGLKPTKEEGDLLYFEGGVYNKATGEARYSQKSLPPLLGAFCDLHKSPSGNPKHWFTVTYGSLLLFLAISSFWMITPAKVGRSLAVIIAGIATTITILIVF